jgi:hypothetical protein
MKSLILAVAGLAAITACSDLRDRRMPPAENSAQRPDLTLPDTASHADSALALTPKSEPPVSPLEQQATRSEKGTAKPRPATPQRHKRSARASTPPADTSVRAYAPNPAQTTAASARDSMAADTSSSRPADTTSQARTAVTDTGVGTDSTVRTDASARPDSSLRPDTANAAARTDTTALITDSATARAADSVTTRPADSAIAAARDTAGPSSSVAAPSFATSSEADRTLATGTEIHAALDDSISSRADSVGETIAAHVMENVVGANGRTLIAAGTPVRFTVTSLAPARSKSSQGRLALRADGIALNGQLRPVKANVKPVPHELRGRGVTGSDAAKVGVGAAGGAVLGRVVGGNTRGAVIGGVAGAAAGAVVASQTATRDVIVKAKTPVVLVLTEPLVTP